MNVMQACRLDGRVAMVTGGAAGLGYFMAMGLAEAGADVAITSRQQGKAQDAARRIAEATGRRALALELDVTDEPQVERAVAHTLGEYGRLDVLVNNAGNMRNSAPFESRAKADWLYTLDVNLTGSFLCGRHVATQSMIPARSGAIINIGSTAGMIGKDRRVYRDTDMAGVSVDYAAAKGGVIALTKDLAAYLAPHGIRVNCISPAGFRRNQPEPFVTAYSDTIMLGRMGDEENELKGAAVFLASDAASFITAHNLVVDGGLTQW